MNKTKIVAKENVNLYLLNKKLEQFASENKTVIAEKRAHLKRVVLYKKIHHLPQEKPFIAAVVLCQNGQWAVFAVKRKKIVFIPTEAISMTNVKDQFEIDRCRYVLEDTLNGFERYKPIV